MKKILLFAVIAGTIGVSFFGGAGGCGGGDPASEGPNTDQSAALEGLWTKQVNGCNGTYSFAPTTTLTITATVAATADGGKASTIYDASTEGFQTERIVVENDTGAAAFCLNPAEDLNPATCSIICTGFITSTKILGNCTVPHGSCGPIIYTK